MHGRQGDPRESTQRAPLPVCMQRSLNTHSPSLRSRPSAHQRCCCTSVSNTMLRSFSVASAPMRCLQQGQMGYGCTHWVALRLLKQHVQPAASKPSNSGWSQEEVCAHPSVTPSRSWMRSCSAALTAGSGGWERWRDACRWEARLTGLACSASAPAIPLPVGPQSGQATPLLSAQAAQLTCECIADHARLWH